MKDLYSFIRLSLLLRLRLSLSLSLLLSLSVQGQVFNGTGGIINDDGTNNTYTLDVTGLDSSSLTTAYGLSEVCVDLTHSWNADLDIRLVSPDGTTTMLTSALGGDGDNYTGTCFSMYAQSHIHFGSSPFTGAFKPYSNIGNHNNGQDGNGTWKLRILDTYAFADGGELLNWSLRFGQPSAAPDTAIVTPLPIFIVHTNDQLTIPDDPKIPGTLRIIDNGPGQLNHPDDPPSYEGYLGIEVRGASSQSFPKKSYGFELWDEEGEDVEAPLLGLPKEDDWIFYAPYTDKTFLRDALTYKLGNDQGNYTSRTVFGELYLNDDYQGVYCLEEKIKRDKNRVDITKLDEEDIEGDEVTGGYILKIDRDDGPGSYFVSNYEGTDPNGEIRVVYEDPEGPDLVQQQHDYIQGFYHAFETALYGDNFKDPQLGYRRYIDVPSFVDFFLVSEFGHNVDAYRLSTFLYKDRNSKDSLLHAGPLWDFNLAYGNVDYCNCQFVEGWAYQNSGACGNTPLWWARLLEDPYFTESVKCRYDELRRTKFHTDTITHYLDRMAQLLSVAEERNYDHWPILGSYVWPNYFIGETYQEEVNYMKNWIADRLTWLDANITGECSTVSVTPAVESSVEVFPNPANSTLKIQIPPSTSFDHGIIFDVQGKRVMEFSIIQGDINSVDVSALQPGIYAVRISSKEGDSEVVKLVVER